MRFLVTGATGFIGGALAQKLAARGHSVRALVRRHTDASLLESMGVEVVRGDLLDRGSLEKAVDGVEGVFHAAAIYAYWSKDPAELYRVNAGGTAALFGAAKQAGVRRAVYTSTVATLNWPGKGRLADESSIARLDDLPGHYKRSKFLGEQSALELGGNGFDVVVVNPTAPFGPGDSRPTPTGRIIVEFLRRRYPGYVNTGLNVCDVDDVAEGHVAAFERGRAGERYILGGANVTLREVYDTLGRVTGLRRRPVRVPWLLAYAAGVVDSIYAGAIRGREPYVPVEGLRVARHPMYVDCAKATRELGLKVRPVEETLGRAARWHMMRLGMKLPAGDGGKRSASGVAS